MSEGPKLAIVTEAGRRIVPADRGGFCEVMPLVRDGPLPSDFAEALAGACDLAEQNGCDWLVALEPGETLRDDALALVAPALASHDAIFGAVHIAGTAETVWRPSRLAFDTADRLPHALLHWWVGRPVFVRTSVLRSVLDAMPEIPGAAMPVPEHPSVDLDTVFKLFRDHRSIKLAQPLLDIAEEPAPLSAAARASVLERLVTTPVYLPVRHGRETYLLPYTGRNAGIEREQTRGQFFEAEELGVLADHVGEGRHIVDIGANTGNHTVFFAGPMRAASVVPFEPLPDIAAILAATVRENGLSNVDLNQLQKGLSDGPGRARVVRSERGGLGASRLEDDPDGEIEVLALDAVLTQRPDFLKIDVEAMEMRVLAGASRTISEARPVIFIEIASENTSMFMEWTRRNLYVVQRIFSDKGHSNYLIAPRRD